MQYRLPSSGNIGYIYLKFPLNSITKPFIKETPFSGNISTTQILLCLSRIEDTMINISDDGSRQKNAQKYYQAKWKIQIFMKKIFDARCGWAVCYRQCGTMFRWWWRVDGGVREFRVAEKRLTQRKISSLFDFDIISQKCVCVCMFPLFNLWHPQKYTRMNDKNCYCFCASKFFLCLFNNGKAFFLLLCEPPLFPSIFTIW